ncbi:MAG TPA: SAM-dependent methyltransferase, partial [Alphaproteobacteria bacterium]|nr:SAM-dependent methyltransferase [Alphaproteobacteria bacterium]
AGFALPVVDRERVAVAYADPMRLFVDLKGMGEGGALSERPRGLTGRSLLRRAAQALEGQDVTFETMFLIGWAPHDTQPLPLKPGSVPAGLARRV